MKKFYLSLLLGCALIGSANAQKEDFNYKFYGFVRGDLFFNTHSSQEAFDGAISIFPLREKLDAEGNDLNAVKSGGLGVVTSRLGLDINGPDVFKAKTLAKLEADFAGFSSPSAGNNHTTLRIRHAFLKLQWKKGQSILLGQTWHPMFGDIMPTVLNLSTGLPFQPFNRSPQITFKQSLGKLGVQASAVFQSQYISSGPNGKSLLYTREAVVPELFAAIDFKTPKFTIIAGLDYLKLRPRTKSIVGDLTYKVKESNNSISGMLAAQYKSGLWNIGLKSIIGQNLSHLNMLGGYAVSTINDKTGEYSYTNFTHSASWLNVVYGKKYQVGSFLGYTKQLGSQDKLVSTDKIYGLGTDINQLIGAKAQFSYNLPHWTIGLEYYASTAFYGDYILRSGKLDNISAVTNHRILGVAIYYF